MSSCSKTVDTHSQFLISGQDKDNKEDQHPVPDITMVAQAKSGCK